MTATHDAAPAVTATTAPYVFVDIDGVLNALHRPEENHEHRLLTVPGDGFEASYHIHIRHTVLEWLRHLTTEHDVRWATTWQDRANDILAPAFDLPLLPVACRTGAGHGVAASHGWWKLAGVVATVAEDRRPFVWIDDDAIPLDVDEHLTNLDVPYLCVRPSPEVGLTDDQLAEIDLFLARHR